MKPPYRQSASLDPTLRAHGCTLFSTLYLQREESGGDISPDTQPAIDEHVRGLRDDAGVTMAQFLARGTTLTEADKAYEAQPFPDRLPPLMRLMHGVDVRDELLPILREGHLALVAVNYGKVQDAGKGVGTFRGGHAIVVGEPESGMVTVADPLRSVLVKWPVDLLVKAMETFGEKPWGNGRGEAGVAYPSPTYKAAYAAAASDLKAAKATLARKAEAITSLNGQVGLFKDERDQARRELVAAKEQLVLALEGATQLRNDLADCQEAMPLDCNAELDRALAAEQKVADALAVLTR
jgi:hypothetical protein